MADDNMLSKGVPAVNTERKGRLGRGCGGGGGGSRSRNSTRLGERYLKDCILVAAISKIGQACLQLQLDDILQKGG
jgi:hypothetical protein